MSRRSYKWDITHVQRGGPWLAADQEPASRGARQNPVLSLIVLLHYSDGPWSILLLSSVQCPRGQDSAWGHRPETVAHMDF